jgi:hypothetical protein
LNVTFSNEAVAKGVALRLTMNSVLSIKRSAASQRKYQLPRHVLDVLVPSQNLTEIEIL